MIFDRQKVEELALLSGMHCLESERWIAKIEQLTAFASLIEGEVKRRMVAAIDKTIPGWPELPK